MLDATIVVYFTALAAQDQVLKVKPGLATDSDEILATAMRDIRT